MTTPSGPGFLRDPDRPGLVRVLNVVAVVGALLVLLGAPVWWQMGSSARGWADDRAVVVTVPEDTTCRTGPPPGRPQTCTATWRDEDRVVEGEVSDRYGGPSPDAGEEIAGRVVGDGDPALAFTGYHPVLLRWALAAPWLTGAGLLLLVGGAAGLVRTDPRWGSSRTDLPQPGAG